MKQLHVFTIFGTPEAFFDGQFKYLSENGYDIILISSDSANAEEFAKRNCIRFVPVPIPRAMSLGSIIRAILSIIRIIKAEKPDAVFGHTPVGALCALIASKICFVKKRVYYRHGLIYTTMKGLKRYVFKLEEKFVASLATSVVNVSNSLAEIAVKEGLNSSKKNYVIGHGTCGGIDAVDIFNPERLDISKLNKLKEDLRLVEPDIVFGFSGRLCIDKGIPELIEGFIQFQNSRPELNSKLLLVGTMDTRDYLPIETQNHVNNNENIIITGWVPKSEIPLYYSLMDVFVFPSRREGFGMCVIEASAMNKPILVSRSHGCVDSIVEHETGEYVDLTATGICTGMNLMLDEKRRLHYGANGRKMVLEWYDYRVLWPEVVNLYRRIL